MNQTQSHFRLSENGWFLAETPGVLLTIGAHHLFSYISFDCEIHHRPILCMFAHAPDHKSVPTKSLYKYEISSLHISYGAIRKDISGNFRRQCLEDKLSFSQ